LPADRVAGRLLFLFSAARMFGSFRTAARFDLLTILATGSMGHRLCTGNREMTDFGQFFV